MMGQLYKLNFSNGKSYIGITTKLSLERFYGHRARAKSNSGSETLLYRAWRKYGEPSLQVLAFVENKDLASTEIRAIEIFKTLEPNGYNVSEGGSVSPMTNPKIAQKVSLSRKGMKFSEEHKKALSNAQKGKPRPNLSSALKGKKASKETKDKMSASAKALIRSPEHIEKLRLSAAKARSVYKEKRERVSHDQNQLRAC